MKTEVFKFEVMVIDHDNLGQEDVVSVIHNTRYPNHCINPKVTHVRCADVEWSDDHPLNNRVSAPFAFRELFPNSDPDIKAQRDELLEEFKIFYRWVEENYHVDDSGMASVNKAYAAIAKCEQK